MKKRRVAVGRIQPGQPIALTVPADWPTEEELAAIRQRCRENQCRCVVAVDDERIGEELSRQPYLY